MSPISKIFFCVFTIFHNTVGLAQQNRVDSLVAKFNDYRTKVLTEKIFVHTDRSSYLTGETLWFKVYCVEGSFHHPLQLSKIVYLEIINTDKKVVMQSKIALEGSVGVGSLFLSASLTSGHYVLRAYTQWMKNFDSDLFFEQPIIIINPFVALSPPAAASSLQYDVQFFPEGGNLVDGLTSVVGVRAVDKNGKGISFEGVVVDDAKDTVAHIRPLKFGLGRFTFRPKAHHRYLAIIRDTRGNGFSYELPPAYEEGFVVQVKDTLVDQLKISVFAKFKTIAQAQMIYALFHTRQVIKSAEWHPLQTGTTSFLIRKALLGEGVSHLTIFNQEMNPVCERLYFKPPTMNLHLQTAGEKGEYDTRDKVNFTLVAKSALGDTVSANLSLAVYEVDTLERNPQHFDHYLWLYSDLKGHVEFPEYYIDGPDTPEKKEAVDNLMLTHGWSRFRWVDILKKEHKMAYLPELGGHLVSGIVVNKATPVPVEGVMTYVSSIGTPVQLLTSRSDKEGRVMFEVKNFYERDTLILQLNPQDSTQNYFPAPGITNKREGEYKVQILNPYSDKQTSFVFPELTLSDQLKNPIEQRSIHMQVKNAVSEIERSKMLMKDSIDFYGASGTRYRLDDYTRFPTLEEVMREYVKDVNVVKRKDGFHFIVWDQAHKIFFKKDPLVLLDGVPIFDIDSIIGFDPLKIKTLDVITRQYHLGALVADGIVSYHTYTNDLGGFSIDPKSVILNYGGLQRQQEFFAPRYDLQEQKNRTFPDTRHLLYWLPNIQTDSQGKFQIDFFTSDISGHYKVVIQGISKGGEPGYSSFTFDVKDSRMEVGRTKK